MCVEIEEVDRSSFCKLIGEMFDIYPELQRIGMVLNSVINCIWKQPAYRTM